MENEFNVIEFEVLDSTNSKAKEMASGGALPWTVVVALRQDEGRGRKGNEWYSPRGGLYFSVVLPPSDIDDLQTLTIMAAFAVAQTIKDGFGVEPFIKLPNDVYLNGKKVCGIMTENVISPPLGRGSLNGSPPIGEARPQVGEDVKCSVMGIGLNTNITEFPDGLINQATSLQEVSGKPIDNKAILEQIITQLQKVLVSISR